MAIYHCNVRVGSKTSGKSASAKSAYITRTEKYAKDSVEVSDSWSGNMPQWAEESPTAYWKAADVYERKNGVLFREVEIALPIELTKEQNKNLTLEFCESITTEKSLPYTVAIHKGKGENPHAHILISERMNDGHDRTPDTWFHRAANKEKSPETGGAKKADLGKGRKAWLSATRAKWSEIANNHLELAGHDERIDHRSYEELGIDKIPSVHLGPNVVEMEMKGIETDRADRNLAIELDNKELEALKAEMRGIDERIRENQKSQGLAGIDGSDRANGTGYGEVERGSSTTDRRGGVEQQASGRSMEQEPGGSHPRYAGTSEGCEESLSGRDRGDVQHQKSTGKNRTPDMGNRPAGGMPSHDSAGVRISALAGLGNVLPEGRGANIGNLPAMNGDRTAQAVRRQLQAMGCDHYEVGIRDAETGKMMNKEWPAGEVVKNVPWLKRMNAMGSDIYIRPQGDSNLVLVDDVDGVTVEQMTEDGCKPALVIETSPKNHQAWVKLTQERSADVRKEIAQGLAKKYDADPNSADAKHYGRLAGFTNRKPEHQEYGRSPYVLCRQSSGATNSKSSHLEMWGIREVERKQLEAELRDRQLAILATDTTRSRPDAVTAYRQEAKNIYDEYGKMTDISRLDWHITGKLLDRGYRPGAIKKAMAEASPDIASRKKGHVEDYVNRTVDKAVERHSEKNGITQSQQRDRDQEMGL